MFNDRYGLTQAVIEGAKDHDEAAGSVGPYRAMDGVCF